MAHQRQQIREYVVAQLIAYPTAAAANVKSMRYIPQRASQLPAISVYAADEQAEEYGSAPRSILRTLKLVIVGWVMGANPEDAADDLAWQIEQVLHADHFMGGLVEDSVLVDTQIELVELGEKPAAAVSLTFEVQYETDAPEVPNGTIGTLDGVNTSYNLNNAQAPDDQATDEENLP